METMSGDESVPEHEGEKFLGLLGFGHAADKWVTLDDGSPMQARNFLDVCGEHAYPVLVELEAMDPSDPDYGGLKLALQGMVGNYIGEVPVES